MASCEPRARGWTKHKSMSMEVVVVETQLSLIVAATTYHVSSLPDTECAFRGPPIAMLGQAGLPASLSISMSRGKETYKDSLSNGERTRNRPSLESGGSVVRIAVWRSVFSDELGPSTLEGRDREGECSGVPGPCCTTRHYL